MKKIMIFVLVLAFNLNAQSIKLISIGLNQTTIHDQVGIGFNIGYGIQKTFSNDILVGIDFNYDQVKIENNIFNGYGADLKVGYKYKDIIVYAIGSGVYQSYFHNDAAGFGFGGGVGYQLFKHFGITMDYKSYSMTSEINNYDFDTVKVYLQILF